MEKLSIQVCKTFIALATGVHRNGPELSKNHHKDTIKALTESNALVSVPGCPRHDLHRLRVLDDLLEEVRPQRGLPQHDVRGHQPPSELSPKN